MEEARPLTQEEKMRIARERLARGDKPEDIMDDVASGNFNARVKFTAEQLYNRLNIEEKEIFDNVASFSSDSYEPDSSFVFTFKDGHTEEVQSHFDDNAGIDPRDDSTIQETTYSYMIDNQAQQLSRKELSKKFFQFQKIYYAKFPDGEPEGD